MVTVCHLSTVHQRRDVRIVYKECASLAKAGHKVHLVIADGQGDETFQEVRIHGVRKYGRRLPRIILSPWNLLFKALSLKAAVYHFHDMELLPIGVLLRLLGRRVIYDVHDNLPKQIMGKHYLPKSLRPLLAALAGSLEAALSQTLSGIVTADANKEKRFRKYHPLVRTVHNYPLLEELGLVREGTRDPRCVCYVGGITKIRGILQLLDAIRPLDVKLLLAGVFEPPELEAECRLHPSWEKVEYKGYQDRQGVAEILSTASVGMVNLLPNENYLDSLPIKMFEYMSAGVPVIASNFPDWQGIVDKYECGVCIDPLKMEEITAAISALLEDREKAELMGRRGRAAIVKDLNWDSEAEILKRLYEEVLSR